MKKIQSEATQQKIQNAIIELLQIKSYREITIAEITKKSQINRTTFYLFYSSKEELIRDITFTFIDWYVENLGKSFLLDGETGKKLLNDTFKKIKKQSKLIKTLLNIQINDFVPYLEIKSGIEEIVYKGLKGKSNNERIILISKLYASSAITTVEWWIDNCNNYSEDFIFEIIYSCLYKGMITLLE